MNEIILSASEVVTLYDPQTAASIVSFKTALSPSRGTAVVKTKHGIGGLILSVSEEKPILSAFSFQKEQPLHKMILPERLICLDVDATGIWCAGGTSGGRIYIWELASGALFSSFVAHYRSITVLRFTSTGDALITGSEDSSINVWSIPSIVNYVSDSDIPTPLITLSDHTLPIKDIQVGFGPITTARIFSASMDSTVKVWTTSPITGQSSSSGPLIATFAFPSPIQHLAVDPSERHFFAGGRQENGGVYHVRMYRQKEGRFPEAVGSATAGAPISVLGEEDNTSRMVLAGSLVTALSLSSSSTLLVGTATSEIKIYDVVSLQLLRTIHTSPSHHPSHVRPVTTLIALPKPPDLVGHIQLTALSGASKEEALPVRPIQPFARTREPKGKLREVPMFLPRKSAGSSFNYSMFSSDHAYLTNSLSPSNTVANAPNNTIELQARIGTLEAEVSHLRNQLDKAQSINDSMWGSIVKGVLAGGTLQTGTLAPDYD